MHKKREHKSESTFYEQFLNNHTINKPPTDASSFSRRRRVTMVNPQFEHQKLNEDERRKLMQLEEYDSSNEEDMN